jgi:hypothetical protein
MRIPRPGAEGLTATLSPFGDKDFPLDMVVWGRSEESWSGRCEACLLCRPERSAAVLIEYSVAVAALAGR